MSGLRELSDSALLSGTKDLCRARSQSSAVLIERIAEIERRKLHLKQSYSSMFSFCVRELGLSEEVAYKRIRVARLANRFPQALEALRDHRIHLRGLVMIAPHMTQENADELLAAACGHTRREIELMLAARFPKDLPKTEIRRLPAPPVASSGASESKDEKPLAFVPPPTPARRAGTAPISESQFKLQVVADRDTHACVMEVVEMLRHRVPDGDLNEVVKLAFLAFRDQLRKERFGVGRKRRGQSGRRGGKRTRHIPDAVKAQVWERDEGRCTYVGVDGKRCGSTSFIEFDHYPTPWSEGGTNTADNLRLLCQPHNRLVGEKEFGKKAMRPRAVSRSS